MEPCHTLQYCLGHILSVCHLVGTSYSGGALVWADQCSYNLSGLTVVLQRTQERVRYEAQIWSKIEDIHISSTYFSAGGLRPLVSPTETPHLVPSPAGCCSACTPPTPLKWSDLPAPSSSIDRALLGKGTSQAPALSWSHIRTGGSFGTRNRHQRMKSWGQSRAWKPPPHMWRK
jgi:hypothetical protein